VLVAARSRLLKGALNTVELLLILKFGPVDDMEPTLIRPPTQTTTDKDAKESNLVQNLGRQIVTGASEYSVRSKYGE
jgi:hypothetical protein